MKWAFADTRDIPADRRGAAMVEMVFSVPILLVLVVGIVEIGSMFHLYHSLSDGTRAAARYLARVSNPCSDFHQSAAASLVVTRTTDWSRGPHYPGWPGTWNELQLSDTFTFEISTCSAGVFQPGPVTVVAGSEYSEVTGLMAFTGLTDGFVLAGRNQQPHIGE